MRDAIFDSFLERQHRDALALAAGSDLLEIAPFGPAPAQRFGIRLKCRGLVHRGGGVTGAECFDIGIQFPTDYLRRAIVPEVLTWFGPRDAWHGSICFPLVCPGHLRPGTGLTELVLQLHQIVTYQKVNFDERNALNPSACAWAREHRARFPLDARPLARAARDLEFRAISVAAS